MVQDHAPEVLLSSGSIDPNAVDENKPNWKSTASATVQLLCGVRDSTTAFGPLRSVAGILCIVLENCTVCLPCRMANLQFSQRP